MSLAYVSRLCARAVQAAVRAEQPATTRRRPPHAGRPPPPSSGGGSPAEVAPAAKSVAEEKARRLRRRAEKDEKVITCCTSRLQAEQTQFQSSIVVLASHNPHFLDFCSCKSYHSFW
ncbi:hypothetical protein DAI22_08g053200 [Oryza sativa Japonica Group]|nr:hypothetical protein DAI22_08g053200 [Oryza sativa Japonica Group]